MECVSQNRKGVEGGDKVADVCRFRLMLLVYGFDKSESVQKPGQKRLRHSKSQSMGQS